MQQHVRAALTTVARLVCQVILPEAVAWFHAERIVAPVGVLQRDIWHGTILGNPGDMVGAEVDLRILNSSIIPLLKNVPEKCY